ncbi:MAG: alpha/beta fold hydrolase [Gammaproteobacteria bacterium]|nr:alpha/beta fold hydrolase [Gammaproteobacteria bacterium]
MFRTITKLAISLTILLLSFASQAQEDVDYFARDTFRIDTVVCPFKNEIKYEPGDMECGLLQVPENREDPDSRFIELHFVKLNSKWDDEKQKENDDEEDSGLASGKREDPVIYLTGGPGSKVTFYVRRFKDHGILKHRDMYILEQRGIGSSGDFCPNYFTRNPQTVDVKTFAEQLDAQLAVARECSTNAAAAGVDLTGYNTIENARDVRALRIALGFERWNVWGISYGSILGQAYIKEDPEAILAVVLDAIVPISRRDDALYWRVVKWYDRDLKKLDEACQAHGDCADYYPDLGKRIREATQSIVDNPIVVDAKNVELFPSGEARFFQDTAAFLPFLFFYEQSNYPGLPAIIYAWADALESRDENLFKGLASVGQFFNISRGMYDAINCQDGFFQAQAASGIADIKEYPVLGSAIGSVDFYEKRARVCHDTGVPPRDPDEYAPVETDIPTLIIEGEMDPITPPPLAKAILPGFSNGTYVEFPYAGHGPSRSVKCAGDMLNKFYDDPWAEPDLSCVDEMEAPDFYAPLFRTSIVSRMLVLASEDRKALALPAAWGGISALAVLVAFIVFPVGAIARHIDRRQAAVTFGARPAAWATAVLGVLAVGILGGAFAATHGASQNLMFFGLVPWARFGAYAGLLAGIAGLATLVLTVRARRVHVLPIATLSGFIITGAAAISLSVFLLAWDLGPF